MILHPLKSPGSITIKSLSPPSRTHSRAAEMRKKLSFSQRDEKAFSFFPTTSDEDEKNVFIFNCVSYKELTFQLFYKYFASQHSLILS